MDITASGDPDRRRQTIIGGHLSWRTSYNLLGAFVGASTNNNLDHHGQMTYKIFGVEGQYYWDHATFYYQTGFLDLINSSHQFEPRPLFFGRAGLRVFLNPSTMLSGEFAYAAGPTPDNTEYAAFIS